MIRPPANAAMMCPVATGSQGWIAPQTRESKARKRASSAKSCLKLTVKCGVPLAVHSFAATLRWPRSPRKFHRLTACRTADFAVRRAHPKVRAVLMSDRPANGSGNPEPVFADIDAATRRLMAALDALEAAAERRRDADRDENELASRIQALGADRSRLADELDNSLVKTRRLERTNREIAEKLDAAIGTIRAVLDRRRNPMSHINVTINGRQYRMACEEGQEVRLLKLAENLEARVESLRGKFGEIGDARLTVMAALTVCDELLDANHAHPRAGRRTRRAAQRPRRRHRSRPRDADRGRQCAQCRRRPHRKDHAGAEPHHRRRCRDRVGGLPLLGKPRALPVIARSKATKQSILASFAAWIASRSLSSGAHSRDPLARNDGGEDIALFLCFSRALALADWAVSPYIGRAKLRCASGAIIPGALSILQGTVPGRVRGSGHMVPTYFRRELRDRALQRPLRLRTFVLLISASNHRFRDLNTNGLYQ